jgi:hypothetical protein
MTSTALASQETDSRLKNLLAKTDTLEDSIYDLLWREHEIRTEISKQKEQRDRMEA